MQLTEQETESLLDLLKSEDETNIDIALTILRGQEHIPVKVVIYLKEYVKVFPVGVNLNWSPKDLTGNIILKIRANKSYEERIKGVDGIVRFLGDLEDKYASNFHHPPKYALLQRDTYKEFMYSASALIGNAIIKSSCYSYETPFQVAGLKIIEGVQGLRKNQIEVF